MAEKEEAPHAGEEEQKDPPQWLRQIQNLSWEPELLTSGGSVVTLYFIIDRFWYLEHYLLQRFEIYPVFANLITTIILIVLGILFITFILHILVRICWIAFVGISFVFPGGIDKEKVQEIGIVHDSWGFAHPNRIILLLENVSSTLFSIPVGLFSMVVGFFLVFFLPAFVVWYFFGFQAAFIFFLAYLAYNMVVNFTSLKHKPFFIRSAKFLSTYTLLFLFENIQNVYFSNLKRGWKFMVGLVVFFCAIGFFLSVIPDQKQDAYLEDLFIPNDGEEASLTRIENNEYEEYRDPGNYVFRASIPSLKTEKGHLELFIARFEYDDRVKEALEAEKDSGERFSIDEIYAVSVDSQKVEGLEWSLREHPKTGQPGVSTLIPIDDKGFGRHEIRIDKKSWHYRKDSLINYEGWETIPFWKESS